MVLAVVGGLLLTEGVMRFLVLHNSERAVRWGGHLRQAGLYADPYVDDQFWRLRWKFNPNASLDRPPRHHPRLGWHSRQIDPETFRHSETSAVGARRPVLLYGASYAACVTAPEDSFGGLLERSDLSSEFGLVNYGVGGYGIDQVYLLMRETLPLFDGDNPVVVVGSVADADYSRAALDFRIRPKPHLRVVDGELTEGPPVHESISDFMEKDGMRVWSYAWRNLLYTSGLPAKLRDRLTGVAHRRRAKDELVEAIVVAIRDELAGRGLDYYFLLFISSRALRQEGPSVEEVKLVELFERLDIPYVRARDYVDASPANLDDLFFVEGRNVNHPTPLGNALLFEALRDGLETFAD